MIAWVYYTPERLAGEQAAGNTVVLDFTADWCLNCKALEKAVLESDRVAARLREPGVTPMKVDITSSRNVAGNALLKEMGSLTIPLLVVLDPAGEVVFRGDFYTADQVVDAVDRAAVKGQGAAQASR
ncbi:MAG: thioredoxin family protein [Myxococcota bacterium]